MKGMDIVGAALCGRPGRGLVWFAAFSPTQGGHTGPPLQIVSAEGG